MSQPAAIQLPSPEETQIVPIFATFEKRRTIREISARPLPPQELANLLWAACGVNRKAGPFGGPGRTAASASNSQEIDVYVALADGVYLYEARGNRLIWMSAEDLRHLAMTPRQTNADAKAPAHFIYVADLHKLTHTRGFQEPGLHDAEVQKSYYFVDTGLIAGNVYLYAAARGLATWFHNCDKAGLAAKLDLRSEQRVLFAQSVGYPD